MRVSFRTTLVATAAVVLGAACVLPAYGSSNRPSAPRTVHAKGASASATVSWSKPASSGGSAITKYVVTSTPSAKTCTTTKLTCLVKGLKNGTSYGFRVVAYNKNGAGVSSAVSNKVTPKASVANNRVLVVTPSTGLTKGQTVKVSGTGFTPNDTVYLVECLANATGQNGCQTITSLPPSVTINAKGVLPTTTFKVMTGTIGNGTCGTTAANAAACAVSAGNATGGDSAQAVIKFKI
jgi:hypothetical protein